MVLELPIDGGWERLMTWMVEQIRDGEDSGISSNNLPSYGLIESSFSMVKVLAFFSCFWF